MSLVNITSVEQAHKYPWINKDTKDVGHAPSETEQFKLGQLSLKGLTPNYDSTGERSVEAPNVKDYRESSVYEIL